MFKVYANCERVEVNSNNEEIGDYKEVFPWDCYGRGETIEDALDNAFDNMYLDSEWRQNLTFLNDIDNRLLFIRTEYEDGNELIEDESIESWKAGRLAAYIAYYIFRIVEEQEIHRKTLIKLDLIKM